jgi:two-component system, chemotaxis family, protein-glutamate methylesterase/glutaminase
VNGQVARARLPVVGIAASAGGPAALAAILPDIAGLPAAVLVVQHLHPKFVNEFVAWMARVSALPVEVAAGAMRLRPGTVYFALPGTHLKLGAGGRTVVLDAEPATLHRPSADELFRSIARHAGANGIGVVLTGLGDDGASGLLALRRAGGTTLVQDAGSSAVHGMPAAVTLLGAADRQVSLADMGRAIRVAVRARLG